MPICGENAVCRISLSEVNFYRWALLAKATSTEPLAGDSLVTQTVKESASNAGDLGLIPGLGRSPGEVMATHSSILAWRIPMNRGAWCVAVQGVAKSRVRLSD